MSLQSPGVLPVIENLFIIKSPTDLGRKICIEQKNLLRKEETQIPSLLKIEGVFWCCILVWLDMKYTFWKVQGLFG